MNDHPGWKNNNGRYDLKGLMSILSLMSEEDANHLRDIIRDYGITTPDELLFLRSNHYLMRKNVGKIFFLNFKKAIYQSGYPYDGDTLEQIENKIEKYKPGGSTFIKLRFEILRRDNFTCQYCGRSPKYNSGVILEMDHRFPASKGGKWTKENIATSCHECNAGKSNIFLEEANK